MSEKKIGDVILDIQNISLRFGGVKALTDSSFNVREHEIRSIIGPNGAGKSSMLNCINGVYTPSEGSITFRGQTFAHMNSRQVAEMGVARTFQNLALFKGMSVIDNIMTGRNLKMKCNLLQQAFHLGPARREELAHREFVENIIDFLEIQAYRKTPVGQLPYGLQKRLNELGFGKVLRPVKTSCENHMGTDWSRIAQWDGAKFNVVSDWYQADKSMVDPLVKEYGERYAKEKNIQIRDCK